MNTSPLSLAGRGHLYHTGINDNGVAVAGLNIIQPASPPYLDDLYVECEIHDQQLDQLMKQLSGELMIGKVIILKFSADNIRFVNCYHGQTPEDPKTIVHLSGQLITVTDCQLSSEEPWQKKPIDYFRLSQIIKVDNNSALDRQMAT